MRKSVILLMLMMLVTLTGCDFLRSIAGRPTSKDIEKKKAAITGTTQAGKPCVDPEKAAVEKAAADSLAIIESLTSSGVIMDGPNRFGGLSGTELAYNYYIIVGVFQESGNARKMFKTATRNGYSPVLISCGNGMTAVGLCPTDRIKSIRDSYGEVRQEKFCPAKAWILVKK